jgi:hypothetical protein
MIQKKRSVGAIGLVIIALLLIANACSKKPSTPTASYSTDLKELSDRFNNDKEKVRLLLILSPT